MIPPTLVEAHLAGTLTDGERRLLEESLRLEPSCARALVQAAKLETALEGHFAGAGTRVPTAAWLSAITAAPAAPTVSGPVPAAWSVALSTSTSIPTPQPQRQIPAGNRRRPWARRTLAAAALLAGAALVVFFQLRQPPGGGADQASRPVPRPRFEEAAVVRSGHPAPAAVTARTPEQEAEALAFRQLVEHYGLTELRLDPPTSVAAALDQILSRAKALNHLNRPEIAAITFRMPEDPALAKRITATTLSLPFQTMALMEAVEWYGASLQCQVACPEAGVLTFVPWTGKDGQPPDDRELVSREYQVPGSDLDQTPGLPSAMTLDTDMETWLRSWGVPMGKGASVTYHSGSGALEATLTEAAHWTLDQKLPRIRGMTGPKLSLTTRLLELVIDYPLENQLLDDRGFQMLTRELSQRKGVDLMTAPTVITRSGLEARVDIYPPEDNGHGGGPEIRVAPVQETGLPDLAKSIPRSDGAQPGVRISILPWVEGEVTKLSGSVDTVAQNRNRIGVDFSGTVPHRHTAFFALTETSDDSRVFAAITVTKLDTGGQSLPEPAQVKKKGP